MRTIYQKVMRTVNMRLAAPTKAEADKLQQRLNNQLRHITELGVRDYDLTLRQAEEDKQARYDRDEARFNRSC
jgi:hypothetical protein